MKAFCQFKKDIHSFSRVSHDDISPLRSVIQGLTRNPVFSWIPGFAGMTPPRTVNLAVYSHEPSGSIWKHGVYDTFSP